MTSALMAAVVSVWSVVMGLQVALVLLSGTSVSWSQATVQCLDETTGCQGNVGQFPHCQKCECYVTCPSGDSQGVTSTCLLLFSYDAVSGTCRLLSLGATCWKNLPAVQATSSTPTSLIYTSSTTSAPRVTSTSSVSSNSLANDTSSMMPFSTAVFTELPENITSDIHLTTASVISTSVQPSYSSHAATFESSSSAIGMTIANTSTGGVTVASTSTGVIIQSISSSVATTLSTLLTGTTPHLSTTTSQSTSLTGATSPLFPSTSTTAQPTVDPTLSTWSQTTSPVARQTSSSSTPATTAKPAVTSYYRVTYSSLQCSCVQAGSGGGSGVQPGNWSQVEDLKARLSREIQAELAVSKSRLSATLARKSSAPDDRYSSMSMGVLATTVIFLVFGIILLADLTSAFHIAQRTERKGGQAGQGDHGCQDKEDRDPRASRVKHKDHKQTIL